MMRSFRFWIYNVAICFIPYLSVAQTVQPISGIGADILLKNNLEHLKDSLKGIGVFKNGYAPVLYKSGKLNYINTKGEKVCRDKEVIGFTLPEGDFHKKYFVFRIDNKKGIVDDQCNIVLDATWDDIDYYNPYGYLLLEKDHQSMLFNASLKQVPIGAYAEIRFLNDSLVEVYHLPEHLWGVLNILTQKIIIPADHKFSPRIVSQNFILCYGENTQSLFDLSGKCIIQPGIYKTFEFESDTKFIHGFNSSGESVMDANGKIIIPPGTYDDISSFVPDDNVFIVKKGNLFGAVNLQNQLTIPVVYEYLAYFSRGVARASLNGDKFLLTTKNVRVGESHVMHDLHHGYRKYKINNIVGFVDSVGQIYPLPEYHFISDYNTRRSIVFQRKTDMKWGFMSQDFKPVGEQVYDDIQIYDSDFYKVTVNKLHGLADAKGMLQIPAEYDRIETAGKLLFKVTRGDKTTYVKVKVKRK